MKTRILLTLVSLFALTGSAMAQTQKTLSVSGGARFRITVPMGYDYQTQVNEDGSMSVLMQNPVWGISITVLALRETDPQVGTSEWQQNRVITFMAEFLGDSKEVDYKFRPLNPKAGSGVYCSFTHRERSGQNLAASCITGGVRVERGTAVYFRILSSDLNSPEYREALAVFTDSFNRF